MAVVVALTTTEDVPPTQVAEAIRQFLTSQPGLTTGTVRPGGGRHAGFNIQLPNGQQFRIQTEELS